MARTIALLLLLLSTALLSGPALAVDPAAAARPSFDGGEPDAEEGIRVLEADLPRQNERITIGEQVVRYRPVGLQVNTQYEVRISHPASNPVRVMLWIASLGGRGAAGAQALQPQRRRRLLGRAAGGRKLLDAERLLFSTDEFGKIRVQGSKSAEVDVLFRAERWALHRDGPGAAPKTLVYDVVLEESPLGLPRSARPIAAWAVLLVVASLAAAPVWAGRVVPALMDWLAQPEGESLAGNLRKARVQ
eukprot:scaffold13.g329.t1